MVPDPPSLPPRPRPSAPSPSASQRPVTFGRNRRVRKRREYLHVQDASKRVTTRHFVLLVAARPPKAAAPQAGPARLGLIVTKKIGNAVARNRVKRVCRECFRLWPSWLPDGVDLVVVARIGADALGLAETRAEWKGVSGLVRSRAEEALARARALPHVSPGTAHDRGAPKP